jgi:hypothetical protein
MNHRAVFLANPCLILANSIFKLNFNFCHDYIESIIYLSHVNMQPECTYYTDHVAKNSKNFDRAQAEH